MVGLKPLQPAPTIAHSATAERTTRAEGKRDPEEGVAGRCYIKTALAVNEPQDENGMRRKEG